MAENEKKDSKYDDLQKLMENAAKTSNPQGETKTVTEGQPSANTEVSGEKKTKTKKPVKDQSTLFTEYGIGKGNNISVDSPAGKLMRVNSKLSEIAGFIVPNSPRFDISVTRNKISKKDEADRYETRINVKEKFSQTIKGVIVNTVPELITRINEEKAARGTAPLTGTTTIRRPDGTTVEVARKTPEVFEMEAASLERTTKIYDYSGFIQWLLDYAWFAISEAPAIFWVHRNQKTQTKDGEKIVSVKDINSPADLKNASETGYVITSKYEDVIKRYTEKKINAAGQVTKSKKPKTVKVPTLKEVYPLSSKYRGRKLAIPGNFIAMKKYETVTAKASYTPEEQAVMNKMYIREGFSVNRQETFQKRLNDMSAQSKERVTITPTGDVTASQFFASNNSLVANADYLGTIYRWWGKPDTVTPLDVRLVKKTEKTVDERTDKNGNVRPAYTKYEMVFTAFGKPGNQLSNTEYANIVKATDGRLTDSDVTSFLSTLSTSGRRDPNTRGGINYDVTIASSQDIIDSLKALEMSMDA